MPKLIKETKDAFYYKFPTGGYYIIRHLESGGVHYYPTKDGELPIRFSSREKAEEFLIRWGPFYPESPNAILASSTTHFNHYPDSKRALERHKVVKGKHASKYPVPKRY